MDIDRSPNSLKLEGFSCSIFDELYATYKSAVFSFSIYLTQNRGEAEDLFQETWLRIIRNNPDKLNLQKIKAWIFTIVVNLHRDNLRKKRIRRLWHKHPLSHKDQENMEYLHKKSDGNRKNPTRDTDMGKDISQALASLPERQRRIFVLKEIAGFKQTEISEMLKIPLGTVKSLMHRAVKHLQRELSVYKSKYNNNRSIKCDAKTLSF